MIGIAIILILGDFLAHFLANAMPGLPFVIDFLFFALLHFFGRVYLVFGRRVGYEYG